MRGWGKFETTQSLASVGPEEEAKEEEEDPRCSSSSRSSGASTATRATADPASTMRPAAATNCRLRHSSGLALTIVPSVVSARALAVINGVASTGHREHLLRQQEGCPRRCRRRGCWLRSANFASASTRTTTSTRFVDEFPFAQLVQPTARKRGACDVPSCEYMACEEP